MVTLGVAHQAESGKSVAQSTPQTFESFIMLVDPPDRVEVVVKAMPQGYIRFAA
jgi:hypothetical protein